MLRFIIAMVGWSATVPAVCAAENLKRTEGVWLNNVSVVNGSLQGSRNRGSSWLFRKTPQGVLISLAGGEKSGAFSGWYLNYDHKGKDARVGLVPEPGPGCYWTWTEGAWKKNPGGFGYTFPCTARPANGSMRGWSLTLDGVKLVLAAGAGAEVHFQGTIDDLDDGK